MNFSISCSIAETVFTLAQMLPDAVLPETSRIHRGARATLGSAPCYTAKNHVVDVCAAGSSSEAHNTPHRFDTQREAVLCGDLCIRLSIRRGREGERQEHLERIGTEVRCAVQCASWQHSLLLQMSLSTVFKAVESRVTGWDADAILDHLPCVTPRRMLLCSLGQMRLKQGRPAVATLYNLSILGLTALRTLLFDHDKVVEAGNGAALLLDRFWLSRPPNDSGLRIESVRRDVGTVIRGCQCCDATVPSNQAFVRTRSSHRALHTAVTLEWLLASNQRSPHVDFPK